MRPPLPVQFIRQQRPRFKPRSAKQRQIPQLSARHKNKLPQAVVDAAMLGYVQSNVFMRTRRCHVVALDFLEEFLGGRVPDEFRHFNRHLGQF